MTVPLLWPRAGTRGDVLRGALEAVLNEAVAITAVGPELLTEYQRWALRAIDRLRLHLRSNDVDRLVRTPAFWAAVALNARAPAAAQLVSYELRDRQDELRQAYESVDSFLQRFADVPASALIVIPDTNVLIAYADALDQADWRGMVSRHVHPHDAIRLVVPLVVVDELDDLKRSGKHETRLGARQALLLLHSRLGESPETRSVLQGAAADPARVTLELLPEAAGHIRLPRADDEIVDIASRLRDMLGERVVTITYDTGADFRSVIRLLKHERLQHERD